MSDDLSERREQTSGCPLEVRLLGPFEVLVGGVPVDVGGSKRGEVVALLALRAGRVLTVETLAEALWGARRPVSARNALQHHIARLRKVLGPTSIVSATDGYALGDAAVDALLFAERLDSARAAVQRAMARTAAQAADEALNLWRGPALLGFLDAGWACTEAGRLEALRVDAMEWRFDAALALGEHSEVLRRIRAAVVENPFRERLWGQLMLALYRSGQQADALDTFQAARRMLSEKLGLEPGPELQRLQAAILAHDAAIGEVPAARRRAATSRRRSRRSSDGVPRSTRCGSSCGSDAS
jgi:DNA-binding SARP family transcriptional activator